MGAKVLLFIMKFHVTHFLDHIFMNVLPFLILELESAVGRFHHQGNKAPRLSEVSSNMQISNVDDVVSHTL